MIKSATIMNRGRSQYWYVKYTVIFENATKPFECSTKVKKTEKSLKYMQTQYLPAWIARKKEELEAAEVAAPKEVHFEYYAKVFMEAYEKNHDYQNMVYRMNRILADFREKDITGITKLEIKRWLTVLKNPQTGAELSKNSKLKYLRAFRGVFELAMDAELFERNLCDTLKLPGGNETNFEAIRPFEVFEVPLLLKASKDPLYGEYLHDYLGVAFNQGMSPSEIIGLQAGDVDIQKRTIDISRAITKGKSKGTKTEYRNRRIPMFKPAVPYFQSLLERAREKRSLWLFSKESGAHLEDIVFIRGSREHIKNNKKVKYRMKWYRLLHDLDIEYRDLKNTRHTWAVRAIESGKMTLQEIADILGHGSLQMLIKHYARWIKNKGLLANKDIDLFGGNSGGNQEKSQKEGV